MSMLIALFVLVLVVIYRRLALRVAGGPSGRSSA